MKQKELFLILVLTVLLLVALSLAKSSRRDILPPPSQVTDDLSQPPKLILTIDPSQKIVQPGEKVVVSVRGESEKKVLAVDLDLSFDPASFTVEKLDPGNFFIEPMVFSQHTNTSSGKIFYALGSLQPSNSQGTLANITLKAKNTRKESVIKFDSQTIASARDAQPAEIVINGGGRYSIK